MPKLDKIEFFYNKYIIRNLKNILENILENIKNQEGLDFLKTIEPNSVDLILTDPPYITSSKSGLNTLNDNIKKNSDKIKKTEEDWISYKLKNIKIQNDDKKENYMKYGSIYGKKYAVQTDYGDWDKEFALDILELFIKEFYDKLKNGGTCIIFFDIWKITDLKNLMEKYNFKQIRFLEWIKTNPQPLNSNINYLTNCREIALLGIKKSKGTFNSKYDKGIYQYPIATKDRFHPTQKNQDLFTELINKHSNKNDIVLDTFLGSGTTAISCYITDRQFYGCEKNKEYFEKLIKRIENFTKKLNIKVE